MARVLLIYIVALIAPLAGYLAWLHLSGRRALATGADLREAVLTGPWPWLLIVGAVLTAASMLVLADFGRSDIGDVYEPPRLVDHEIVPGRTVPRDR